MKTEIQTIVLVTDLLLDSMRTLGLAVLLARQLGAHLVIVSALELGYDALNVERLDRRPSCTRMRAGERMKLYVAEAERNGVAAASVLLEGVVPDVILSAVIEVKADLLVAGTPHMPNRVEHFLTGSNTEALMLKSTCPTLIIGPEVPACADASIDGHLRKVICVSDFSPASARAAPFAMRLSRLLASTFEIYQVEEEVDLRDKATFIKEVVEPYCSLLRTHGPDINQEWCAATFQMGRIIEPAQALEKSLDPSVLMVLGAHSASLLKRHLHPSFTYRLIANARCPIITIRS